MTGTAAIIGAGLIGRGWSIVFARSGWQVRLYDLSGAALDQAMTTIGESLADLAAYGLIQEPPETVLGRITPVAELAAAVEGAAYVQENGPERLDDKQALFQALDEAAAAETILASSTSGFKASAFTAELAGRRRCLVAHPVNPPHLVPLVELAPADWTDAAVVDRTREIMLAVGQTPIVVKREIDGFILNRLQAALMNEAFRLAEGGYAAPEDIDKTVSEGLGLRWSFIGPFETADLNAPGGIRDYAERYGGLLSSLGESQTAVASWRDPVVSSLEAARRSQVAEADLAERQAWRDRRLMALAAHKAREAGKN